MSNFQKLEFVPHHDFKINFGPIKQPEFQYIPNDKFIVNYYVNGKRDANKQSLYDPRNGISESFSNSNDDTDMLSNSKINKNIEKAIDDSYDLNYDDDDDSNNQRENELRSNRQKILQAKRNGSYMKREKNKSIKDINKINIDKLVYSDNLIRNGTNIKYKYGRYYKRRRRGRE